jgi:hypothetical protein
MDSNDPVPLPDAEIQVEVKKLASVILSEERKKAAGKSTFYLTNLEIDKLVRSLAVKLGITEDKLKEMIRSCITEMQIEEKKTREVSTQIIEEDETWLL